VKRMNVEVIQKQQKALRLRNLGASYDQIAEQMGYFDRSGARKAVKACLDRAEFEPVMEQRFIQSERLDMMVTRCLQAVLNGDLDQVRNVIAIEKRRAELWGLDATKTIEVTGQDGGAIQTDLGQVLIDRLQALSVSSESTLGSPQSDSNVIDTHFVEIADDDGSAAVSGE
jgi:hypothetical protein